MAQSPFTYEVQIEKQQQRKKRIEKRVPMYLLGCLSSTQFGYYSPSKESTYSHITKPLSSSLSSSTSPARNEKLTWREQMELKEKEQKMKEEELEKKKSERVHEIVEEKGSKPAPAKNWRERREEEKELERLREEEEQRKKLEKVKHLQEEVDEKSQKGFLFFKFFIF